MNRLKNPGKISEKFGKIRKNPENPEKSGKIQKPDEFPKIKIIISYLRSKPSILFRNIVKITEI